MSTSAGKAVVRWLSTLAIFIVVVAAAWWGYRLLTVPGVNVTKAVMAPVVQAFYATGTLLPDREYPIKSSVEGVITQVNVDKGDQVTKGQVLAVLRADDYVMKLRQAQADLNLKEQLAAQKTSPTLLEFDAKLKAATQQLDVATRENKRIENMVQANAASPADLDRSIQSLQEYISLTESLKKQRATKLLELDRDLTIARQALEIAQWNFDRQTIKSPITGSVLDRPATAGTRVQVNNHLMNIADVRPKALVMRAAVDEEDKTRLMQDQQVIMTLYAYPGRPFTGKVKTIYPMADDQRRTFEVDVILDQPDDKLAAGMTGELAFIVERNDSALVIPSQAVRQGKVWTVHNNKLTHQEVKVGISSVQRSQILSGLKENQLVVVSPSNDFKNNQQVSAHEISPAQAAGVTQDDDTSAASFKGIR